MTNQKRSFSFLSSFSLKIIACLLMTLDHVALLFIPKGSGVIPTDYYVLRAIGKMAFPIFAFLAVEGVYHTKDIKKYLLRLAAFAIGLDIFGYIIGAIKGIAISQNPLVGNAFTDIFLGVLTVYLLKKKNKYSLFALFPVLYAFFSTYPISVQYGTLFKADWGFFSVVLFITFFLAKELSTWALKRKALQEGIDESIYIDAFKLKYDKAFEIIALVTTELIFSLIWKINNTAFVLPNEFIPIGTYSTLAGLFLAFYNGKRGPSSPIIKWSFYSYYPLHLAILGIISLFVGVLSTL